MDNRTRNLLTAVGLLLPILGLVLFYMFSFLPQKQEVERLETQVSQNEDVIRALEEKADDKQDESYDTNALQRMVPVKPLVDQFILDLNQAELVSRSKIQQLDFVDEVLNPEQYAEESDSEESANAEAQENQPSEETGETIEEDPEVIPTEATETVPGLPEGIQSVNVSMAMISDNYPSLRTFLQSIEGLPRMAMVSGLSFTGKPESVSFDDSEGKDEILYTADVSTFYIPTLTDLRDHTPSIDYPEPADKENPLYEAVKKEEAKE
ncbi:hypothetical protein [Guptibacillus hwajinpoensis]|uniref:Type IV pilus assembly protein PilO n=1 Tax=Guptibacillus hwajinpoensis TaxID=208199 RepID=A0ABU0JWG8_9BACL|nr:hypothetical protein [Alkalihalobacillus hemicentroti]MDQ0481432.1 type IV pilus assembly protein PilO [Alkalihalobacillus hemicentroti]